MRKQFKYLFLIILVSGTSSCQQTRDVLGFTRTSPDEFSVVSNAPLSLPPGFEILPPSSNKAPLRENIEKQAKNVIFPNITDSNKDSQIDNATSLFVEKLDVSSANQDIREVVNREYANFVADKNGKKFARYPLGLFKGESRDFQGEILNANYENEKIVQAKTSSDFDRNFKAGDISYSSIDDQIEDQVKETQKKGLLNRIFGF